MCLTTGPGAGQGSISSLHLPRIPVPIPWLSGVSRGGERVCSQEDRGVGSSLWEELQLRAGLRSLYCCWRHDHSGGWWAEVMSILLGKQAHPWRDLS